MVSSNSSLGYREAVRFHGFVVSSTKPWNLTASRCPRDGLGETTKPWNLTAYQCPRDGLDETVKPWNLTSSQCLRDGLDETMKPRNHETMKPDVFSMSQRWIGHGVDETTKPVDFSPSRDGEDETTKPWNHETCRLLVIQRWSGRNHETMKPWNHETCRHFNVPEMEWSKPWNHVDRFLGFMECTER